MSFSKSFLNGRLAHLMNKLKYTERTLVENQTMPERHRVYKLNVHIPDIIAAIQRLENAKYGYCLSCEEPIDKKRLLRMPHAARCTHCQSTEELKKK